MPSDNLFPDSGSPKDDGAQNPTPPGNGHDVGGQPLSLAQAAELVTQANAPLMARLEELAATNAELARRLSSNQPVQQTKPTNEPAQDFLTQFTSDPEGAISALVGKQFQSVVPLLGNLMNSGVSAFVGLAAQEVDQEFGSGAWTKFFDKPMSSILNNYR